MNTSPDLDKLAVALSRAQGAIEGALKSSANPFFKSKYADLSSVWDACREPLAKNGLSVIQFPKMAFTGTPEIYEWTSRQGEARVGVRAICVVSVTTRLLHESGQFLEDENSALLASGDPQAVGSAITYLRRYSLQSVVGVAPEDDDGHAASQSNGKAMAQPQPPPKPENFDNWWLDAGLTAKDGMTALQDIWSKGPQAMREYVNTTRRPQWEALKIAAALADKDRKASEHGTRAKKAVPS